MTLHERPCKVAAMKKTLLPLALLLAAPLTSAQDAADDAPEAPQYYQVEVLVFQHLDQSRNTPEIPRLPEPELAEKLEQDLARLGDEQISIAPEADSTTADDAEVNDHDSPWFPVANTNLMLNDTVARLERLDAYDVIAYTGWGQQAPDVTLAEAVDLAELGIDPDLVNGSIELYQRRYLHLAVDVALAGDGDSLSSDNLFESGPAAPAIKDSRRIRLEELQYFDQPQFGVIAVVSRIEAGREELAEMPADSAASLP